MAFTTIAKPSDHFTTKAYDGSDSTTTITGLGFKPDFLWVKRTSGSGNNILNTSSKGTATNFQPDSNSGNDTTVMIASYTSDGCTLTGNIQNSNDGSETYIGRFWKANGAVKSSNTSGSITSTVQANTSAGISIIEWTGSGANATVGHSLGVVPKAIWIKNFSINDQGECFTGGTTFVADPETDSAEFASNFGDDATAWNDTAHTSTLINLGSQARANGSSGSMVAVAFAEVQGFSKFGFYSGTGNAQGTKVYCGFRPRYVMIHNTSTTEDWAIKEIEGLGNIGGSMTFTNKANTTDVLSNATVQFESNGFRLASTDGKVNGEDVKYQYFAFAEMPMVGTNGTIALAT